MIYDFINKPDVVYFKVAGLIILMFGLYKSTQQWTADNKREDSSDDDNAERISFSFNTTVIFDEMTQNEQK